MLNRGTTDPRFGRIHLNVYPQTARKGEEYNMKTVRFFVVPALLIAFASAADAGTITVGSYGSSNTNPGFANSGMKYQGYNASNPAGTLTGGTNASENILDGAWVAAVNTPMQSSWVSYTGSGESNGVQPPNGYYAYVTSFTATGGSYSGQIGFMADDTGEVILDAGTPDALTLVNFAPAGNDSYCEQYQPNCNSVDWVSFSGINLLNGVNTLTVIDDQVGLGGAGFDFEGQFNSAAAPEPGSLLLMGTGLLGLAFVLFRKGKRNATTRQS